MRPSSRPLAAGLLAVLATASAAVAADAYPVQIDRPAKVGQRLTVTAKADVTESVTSTVGSDKPTSRADKYTADLTGTMTVEAVAAKTGLPSTVTVELGHLVREGTAVLPPGTAVTIDHVGKVATYTVDGRPLAPAVAGVLAVLLDVDKADQTVTEGQAAATDKPQPVGGTWAGHADRLAALLTDAGLPFGATTLTVDGRVVSAAPADGVPAVVVETTVVAEGVKRADPPKGFEVTGGGFRRTSTYTLPTDPTLPVAAVEQVTKMTLKSAGKAPDGRPVDGELKVDQTVRRTFAPAAAPAGAARPPR